jgi:hypothetical protein
MFMSPVIAKMPVANAANSAPEKSLSIAGSIASSLPMSPAPRIITRATTGNMTPDARQFMA